MKTNTTPTVENRVKNRQKVLSKASKLGVLLVLLAGTVSIYSLIQTARQTLSPGASDLHQARQAFYFRNALWVADGKTFAHMIAYLLRPEGPAAATNVVSG